jgi:ribosomal protein S18 acetylase RimI-like enzyme
MAFHIRRLAPSDLPAFRALHDGALEVSYDDAFYASLRAARDRHGHGLLSLVALDAAGALAGGLSARLARGAPAPAASDPLAWAWAGLLLPLRFLSHALRALWEGGKEEREGGSGGGGGAATTAGAGELEEGSGSAAAGGQVVAYLMTLCVAPAARRQGLGRALVLALLQELRSAAQQPRCAALELHMLEGNAAAARLYASLGFAAGARHENYYYFGSAYHHAVHWRRELAQAEAGEAAAAAARATQPAGAAASASPAGAQQEEASSNIV